MKYLFCIFSLLVFHCSLLAQHTVRIIFEKPANTNFEKFYFAGNINNWQPAMAAFQFVPRQNNQYQITFSTVEPVLNYKLTAGSWETVELDKALKNVTNRTAVISSDTTLWITVANFKTGESTRKSTASKQVSIVTDSFYFPTLKAYKRVWVYLPKNYTTQKLYPVLYMHDGQNIFDAATSFSGEWGVDEFLDSAKDEIIVVAIDNGGQNRMSEYSCDTNAYVKNPSGKMYCYDLVTTLLPFIAKKYKASSLQKDNYIIGSSMGANISLYMALYHPHIFGKIGLFSPAFWINKKEIAAAIKKQKAFKDNSFYIYAGTNEGPSMVSDAKMIKTLLDKKTGTKSIWSITPKATHSEPYWQKETPKFFQYLGLK